MDTPKHRRQMEVLLQSLELAWKDRADFYAGGNMFFYFSETQSKKNDFRGPDVFVVLDPEPRAGRKSWVVWEEGGRCPDVIIELTSDSTRDVDHGAKKEVYARLGVPEYFIFDPLDVALEGYVLDVLTREYVALEPDERGWLPSRRLGLWLGVEVGDLLRFEGPSPYLRWFDAERRLLPVPEEALREAQARAEAEAARTRELEAKLEALEPRPGDG